MNKTNKKSSKLNQFIKELGDLLKKHQYSLVPEIQFDKNGISPVLKVYKDKKLEKVVNKKQEVVHKVVNKKHKVVNKKNKK